MNISITYIILSSEFSCEFFFIFFFYFPESFAVSMKRNLAHGIIESSEKCEVIYHGTSEEITSAVNRKR